MNSKKISENFKMPKLNPGDTIMEAALTVTDKSGNTDTDTLTLSVLSEKRNGKP
jgi:hypothetical protein